MITCQASVSKSEVIDMDVLSTAHFQKIFKTLGLVMPRSLPDGSMALYTRLPTNYESYACCGVKSIASLRERIYIAPPRDVGWFAAGHRV